MKLELKHLAPYLPYGLKAKGYWGIRTIKTLYKEKEHHYYAEFDEKEKRREQIWTIRPILRPLSDLTKDNLIEAGFEDWEIDLDWILNQDVKELPYGIVVMLFENHFDVLNLIPKGLAIDINLQS